MRSLLTTMPLLAAAAASTPSAQPLEAAFAADRVIVTLRTAGGDRLRFYTDTGGGGTVVYLTTAERLAIATAATPSAMAAALPPSARIAERLPAMEGGPPPPTPALVMPDFIVQMGGPAEADGFLGANWFAGRIWTWDYRARTLALEDNGWKPSRGDTVVPVTFKASATGVTARPFPRIVVAIGGEPTSMLLDTGAETLLKPAALASLGGGPALRATSMISASRLAAWRAAHPTWRVVEDAQVRTGARMIEVPDVVIAGFQVGPVWFTERPDPAFHGMMSAAMDAPVEGAIGGNAFRTLRMTVDYRSGRAAFSR